MRTLLLTVSILFCSFFSYSQAPVKYNHILITNDDGAEDIDRLFALAKSVKSVANRVSIIVSSFDRSGTSNHTTFGKHQSTLEIKCRYNNAETNIAVYTTPGNPADCVLIGLNGLFPDDKPDLVLSGINGGANIGPGWFGSGTIGAIRTAAFLGVRGIALSGFEDDDERSFEVIPRWITQLISTDLIDKIDKNSYLTIGFPDVKLEEVKGVKISDRRISFDNPKSVVFNKVVGDKAHEPESITVWAAEYKSNPNDITIEHDDTLLNEGYIIITPMSIDENNFKLNKVFQDGIKQIPNFTLN
ncbi:5'/3'-nucleotidase SurE [Fulvivirga lutimaris]|uniref:5'/3'-nucleotidase SurE n=1 Tax=Fulvivirga lutimaris TaxID=1819566 RepID=UPI0012BC8E7A|nr:5'/3'-nucleotidase SurE [Fulvivirga lutimaris]MTI38649.1 hypothetical protein [Fulvivirga lutimaris]